MTSTQFLSAEEVADELGLHVRTIRTYIRDGRLRAARVGKQYRITRGDVAAFVAGQPASPSDRATPPVSPDQVAPGQAPHSTVVVDLDNISSTDSDRIITALTAAVGGRTDGTPLRLTTAPDPTRRSLKVIAQGSISDTADVLTLLRDIADGGNFS